VKQKDIALIIVIVFVSGVLSFVVSNKFISPPKHDLKAAKVEPINAEFHTPDSGDPYFNERSVNPTQLIRVQDNSNKTPLNGE
jgi:hypothetical protein